MLVNGVVLMVVGMTTVFLFLGILVICVQFMALVMQKFPDIVETKPQSGLLCSPSTDEMLAVAIVRAHAERMK